MTLSFFVPGRAAPGGSKRAFAHRATGRIIVVDDAVGNRDWKSRVADFARQAMGDRPPLTGPLEVEFAFLVSRPKGHHGSGRNAAKVKTSAPRYPTVKPDVSKLIRAAEDACKDIVWKDDCQIVRQSGTKDYGDRPGVTISVWEVGS